MAITLKIISDVKQGLRGLDKISDQILAVNQSFQLATSVAGIASDAFAKVSQAVGFVIKAGSQFEDQLATIRGLVGDNDKAFEALRKTAIQLGNTTRFSASQAAEAFISLQRAGLDTNKILASTADVLSLAAANNLDLSFAAETTALALNVFEKQGLKSNDIVNELTKTANSSAQTFGELSEAFRVAAPTAAAFNIKFKELNFIIGALADSGFKASEAGTAIRSTLARLANPVGDTAKVLAELGLTAKQVSPAFNTFEQILDNVKNAQIDTTQATRLLGQEAGSKFISVFTKGGEVLRKFSEKQKQATDAAGLQQERLKTLSGRVALFNSALETLGIKLFDVFEPTFKFIVDGGTSVLNFFNTFTSRVKIFFVGLKQVALNASVAIFEGFVSAVGAIKEFFGFGNKAPAFISRLKSEIQEVNDEYDDQRVKLTNVINGTEKYAQEIDKAVKANKRNTNQIEQQLTAQRKLEKFVATSQKDEKARRRDSFVRSQGRQVAGTVVGVEAGIRGFEQGGAIGAITGVATQILLSNEKFREQIARLNEAIISLIDPIVESLIPIFDAAVNILTELKPLFQSLGDQLSIIVGDIGPILKELSPTIRELVSLITPLIPAIRALNPPLLAIAPAARALANGMRELQGGINALSGNINALKNAVENLDLSGGGSFGGGGGGGGGFFGFNQGGLITKDRMVRLPGMEQDAGLIMAHEGERVVSNNQNTNSNTFNITVNAGFGSDGSEISNMLREELEKLSLTGRLAL